MKRFCIAVILFIVALFIGYYAGHAHTMHSIEILYTEEGYVELADQFGDVNFYEYIVE